MTANRSDVTIIGNGLAGLSLACAIPENRTINLVGAIPPPTMPAPNASWASRIYALSPASAAFLQELGAWQRIAPQRLTQVYGMEITGRHFGDLKFSAYQERVAALAWIVESDALCAALQEVADSRSNIHHVHTTPTALRWNPDGVKVTLPNGSDFESALLVAADGAQSWARQQAGIGLAWWHDYQQIALVANFSCDKSHENSAFQWFLAEGVLAYLPLGKNQISVVWSMPASLAHSTAALSPEKLAQRIASAGYYRLGALQPITQAHLFPLSFSRTTKLIGPRMALIGDAAHTLHPLSGHGANLGLGDAKTLSQAIASLASDCGDERLLRIYERRRLMPLAAVQWVTHSTAWAYQGMGTSLLGDASLTLAQRLPLLRSTLARYAMDWA